MVYIQKIHLFHVIGVFYVIDVLMLLVF